MNVFPKEAGLSDTNASDATSPAPRRGGDFGRDLTVGSIPRHLLAVSLPMLLGTLINSGYSIVNTIWVGKIVGAAAVGATAASFPVVFIFIGLASAATMATSILVSQYYGAKRLDMVERTVNTSFTVAILFGSLLTLSGVVLADRILGVMGTPPEVFHLASPYLKITMGGFVLMFLSFLITSILRGLGDTRTPLLFMAAGVAINAVLDPLLIIGIGPFPKLGLSGAAIASVISAACALLLGVIYLNRTSHLVAFHPRRLAFDPHIAWMIAKLGFPSMIQQTLVSVSAAVVTSFVNAFGAGAIAAFGASLRIDTVAFMPSMSLGMSTSALAGQNLGAGKVDRVKDLFKWGAIMSSTIAGLFMVCEVAFPRQLLSMFLNEPEVIEVGVHYLRIVSLANIPFAVMFVSNGIINGAGHTITTMLFTFVSLWLLRVPIAAILSKTDLGLIGIWIAMVASVTFTMCVSLAYYASRRWQKVVIRGRPGPVA
jgi:putative MATE family efflux protein